MSVFIPEPSEVQNLSAQIDANSLLITLYQNILGTTLTYSSTNPSGSYSFEIIPLLHES